MAGMIASAPLISVIFPCGDVARRRRRECHLESANRAVQGSGGDNRVLMIYMIYYKLYMTYIKL